MRVYLEPRDWWIGYYRGAVYHYVCVLPCVVIRWKRRNPVPLLCSSTAPRLTKTAPIVQCWLPSGHSGAHCEHPVPAFNSLRWTPA